MIKIKAIIFDWDGTIIDSLPHVSRIFDETLREFGAEPLGSMEDYKNIYSGNDWVAFAKSRGIKEAEFADFAYSMNEKRKAIEHEIMLFSGMRSVLNTLNKKFRLGIVSSYFGPDICRHLERMEMRQLFGQVIGSEIGKRKPDPILLETCMKKLGVLPHETVYIGDSEEDVVSARLVGVARMIAVSYGFSPVKKIMDADMIAHSPRHLSGILEGIL